jgi:hypothetical protein
MKTQYRFAAIAAASLCAVVSSSATAGTFFQFLQTTDTPTFSYDGVGTWSGVYNLGLAATFDAGQPNSIFLPPGSPVTVTFSASTLAPQIITGPDQFDQGGYSGSITFSTPTIANLLTATFTGGVANFEKTAGGDWSSTFGVSGVCGTSLCYTSDFQTNVNGFSRNDFSLAFSGGNTVEGPYSAAGTFAGAVPEPAAWTLLIAGFSLVGAAARRRRTMPEIA